MLIIAAGVKFLCCLTRFNVLVAQDSCANNRKINRAFNHVNRHLIHQNHLSSLFESFPILLLVLFTHPGLASFHFLFSRAFGTFYAIQNQLHSIFPSSQNIWSRKKPPTLVQHSDTNFAYIVVAVLAICINRIFLKSFGLCTSSAFFCEQFNHQMLSDISAFGGILQSRI